MGCGNAKGDVEAAECSSIQVDPIVPCALTASQLGVYGDVLLEGGILISPQDVRRGSQRMGHGVGFTESELLHLRSVFNAIDADDVGFVGKSEFMKAHTGEDEMQCSAEDLADVLESLEEDGFNTMDFDEFVRVRKAIELRQKCANGNQEMVQKYRDFVASNRAIIAVQRDIRSRRMSLDSPPEPIGTEETLPFTDEPQSLSNSAHHMS